MTDYTDEAAARETKQVIGNKRRALATALATVLFLIGLWFVFDLFAKLWEMYVGESSRAFLGLLPEGLIAAAFLWLGWRWKYHHGVVGVAALLSGLDFWILGPNLYWYRNLMFWSVLYEGIYGPAATAAFGMGCSLVTGACFLFTLGGLFGPPRRRLWSLGVGAALIGVILTIMEIPLGLEVQGEWARMCEVFLTTGCDVVGWSILPWEVCIGVLGALLLLLLVSVTRKSGPVSIGVASAASATAVVEPTSAEPVEETESCPLI